MWVTKLLISPLKKDFLPKNDPIWPEIGISIHFGPGLAGSVGALSVGLLVVAARAVSRKTFIYFMIIRKEISSKKLKVKVRLYLIVRFQISWF